MMVVGLFDVDGCANVKCCGAYDLPQVHRKHHGESLLFVRWSDLPIKYVYNTRALVSGDCCSS